VIVEPPAASLTTSGFLDFCLGWANRDDQSSALMFSGWKFQLVCPLPRKPIKIPSPPRLWGLRHETFTGKFRYYVSTVGTDEEVVRAYIKNQEKEDHRVEQLSIFK